MPGPLIESLEPRSLFAATPLPDLTATLVYTPTTVVRPGTTITPSLTITNIVAAITKSTRVPIRLFVSTTPTLDPVPNPSRSAPNPSPSATTSPPPSPSKRRSPPRSKLTPTTSSSRSTTRRPSRKPPSPTTSQSPNPSPTPPAPTPATSPPPTAAPVPLTLKLSNLFDKASSTTPLFTDFTDISDGARITRTHLRSRLSTAGDYVLTDRGSYEDPTLGHVTYNLSLRATLSNNHKLTGTFRRRLAWHTVNMSRNSTSTFTATKT